MVYKAPEKVKQYISTSFSHAYYYDLPLRCLTSPHHYIRRHPAVTSTDVILVGTNQLDDLIGGRPDSRSLVPNTTGRRYQGD